MMSHTSPYRSCLVSLGLGPLIQLDRYPSLSTHACTRVRRLGSADGVRADNVDGMNVHNLYRTLTTCRTSNELHLPSAAETPLSMLLPALTARDHAVYTEQRMHSTACWFLASVTYTTEQRRRYIFHSPMLL